MFDERWIGYARRLDDFALQQRILSRIPAPEDFKPHDVFQRMGDVRAPLRVLDFGCGIGRMIVGALDGTDWHVCGYDSTAMLDRAGRWLAPHLGFERVELSSRWNDWRVQRFDLVMAVLVFQHIPEPILREYYRDLRDMTQRLCVLQRGWNDSDQTDLWDGWPLLLEYFSPIDGTDERFAARTSPGDHYFVVLEPKENRLTITD